MRPGVLLLTLLAPSLAGCTLLTDEEPFEILLVSEMEETRTGSIVVTDDGGGEVFRKSLSVSDDTIRTAFHIGALEGRHTVAWESEGRSWSDTREFREGDSVTIVLRSATEVCFDFRQTTGNGRVCDTDGG